MTDTVAPRIYVACLASYNNGVLHGRWIDASADVADMWPEINAILRESKFPNVTVPDYEATARAAGWTQDAGGWWNKDGEPSEASAKDVCEVPDSNRPKLAPLMVPSAEEWAIHDHEGLGDLGEYAGLAEVARRVSIIDLADERDIPAAVLLDFARERLPGEWDISELESAIDDNYRGKFDDRGETLTWADMAEDLEEETGGLDEVPERFRNYIDFEAIGRDLRLGGDLSAYSHDGDMFFFWNH